MQRKDRGSLLPALRTGKSQSGGRGVSGAGRSRGQGGLGGKGDRRSEMASEAARSASMHDGCALLPRI